MDEISQGIGWGFGTSLFEHVNDPNAPNVNLKIDQLIGLINKFPTSLRHDLHEGVKFAFSDQVTPKLDNELFIKYDKELNKRSSTTQE